MAIDYTLLAKEFSVRSNHLDPTHLHLMPPFTWFWPERGVDHARLEENTALSFLRYLHPGRPPPNSGFTARPNWVKMPSSGPIPHTVGT